MAANSNIIVLNDHGVAHGALRVEDFIPILFGIYHPVLRNYVIPLFLDGKIVLAILKLANLLGEVPTSVLIRKCVYSNHFVFTKLSYEIHGR